MAKYRKKAVEVDAYQLGHGQMPAWFMKAVDEGRIELWPSWTKSCNSRVRTRTDWVEAVRDDYVFLNHRGDLQVWKKDEFLKVFEPNRDESKQDLVEITKAETTAGFALGDTITISANFKGIFCEAQLDEYIKKLIDIRDKIQKWKHTDGSLSIEVEHES